MRRYGSELTAFQAELARTVMANEVELRAQAERHDAELARLNERLEARANQHRLELAAAEERIELVRGDREQLRRDVQAVSADVLKKTGAALTREGRRPAAG
jgi:DNA anti-recombination protein RmuC